LAPGFSPTIASYNASIVNFYNATRSLERFENQKIFHSSLKNAVDCNNAGIVAVNSKVAGLAPGKKRENKVSECSKWFGMVDHLSRKFIPHPHTQGMSVCVHT
jgi:hypothetical protein